VTSQILKYDFWEIAIKDSKNKYNVRSSIEVSDIHVDKVFAFNPKIGRHKVGFLKFVLVVENVIGPAVVVVLELL
jgi:hypothetical protein